MFVILKPLKSILTPHLQGKIIQEFNDKRFFNKYVVYILILLISLQVGYSLFCISNAQIDPRFRNHLRLTMLNDIIKKNNTKYEDVKS